MMNKIAWIILLFGSFNSLSQFDGPAGTPGSLAMAADSSAFIDWADNCGVTRGPMDIMNPGLGMASHGFNSYGTGYPNNQVVSLGDGGFAILTFPSPIMNGPGPDFAVFENAFHPGFLELAFVEVSSDGSNYHRFPATSLTPADMQVGPFDTIIQAQDLNNLAGKYQAGFGVPFDLEGLDSIPSLNIDAITHVKLIDVIGTIQDIWGSYDHLGNIINDPYSTPFPSSGFDLDAVGVIHQAPLSTSSLDNKTAFYPNPATTSDWVQIDDQYSIVSVSDMTGRQITLSQEGNSIQVNESGYFFVQLQGTKESITLPLLVK